MCTALHDSPPDHRSNAFGRCRTPRITFHHFHQRHHHETAPSLFQHPGRLFRQPPTHRQHRGQVAGRRSGAAVHLPRPGGQPDRPPVRRTSGGRAKPTGDQTPELANDLALGVQVLQEFLDADTVVIGVALYNFTISTQLKAWIDRVLVAGKTFRYTAEGALEGLAGNKRVILAVARGGRYGEGSPTAALEHAETYMRAALGFVGLHQPEVVVAEGLALGPEARAAGMAAAQAQIDALPV
ncbi:ACP phosphodiesterase [Xanthomonas campestris pv. campestris]